VKTLTYILDMPFFSSV